MQAIRDLATGAGRLGLGVTCQNIPQAGVYPGILWPRPIYTPGYILAHANSYSLRPQYTPGYKLAQAIIYPGII